MTLRLGRKGSRLITLKSFPSAAFIIEKMNAGANVYATVIEGKYKGTIGKIIDVRRHHYDRHEYSLEINGKTIKICGSVLKESSEHEVALVFNPDYIKEFKDFNDRLIEVGKLIVILKQSNKSAQNQMVMGNVRKIDSTGIFVEPFAVNGSYFVGSEKYIRITKTQSTMIIDSTTQHVILLNKLAAVDQTEK